MDTVAGTIMAVPWQQKSEYRYYPQNMSIQARTDEVDKVKRSENGVVRIHLSFPKIATLRITDELMAKFRISSVHMIWGQKLVGIITNMI